MMAKGAGVKVWFDDVCTIKKTGFAAMMKSTKQKAILVLPWKVCWLNNDFTDPVSKIRAAVAEAEKCVDINDQLTVHRNTKEVTLEFPDVSPSAKAGAKPIKETFVFESESAAVLFCQTIEDERTRNYLESENFAPTFRDELNRVIRQRIVQGDHALKEMYLACHSKVSPSAAVEALFTNYRTVIDEAPSAASFAHLLSAVAQDPVVYLLFLCCTIAADERAMGHFQRVTGGREISSGAQLFDQLLTHVGSTVRAPEWTSRRVMLLLQFQYPVSAVGRGSSGKCNV